MVLGAISAVGREVNRAFTDFGDMSDIASIGAALKTAGVIGEAPFGAVASIAAGAPRVVGQAAAFTAGATTLAIDALTNTGGIEAPSGSASTNIFTSTDAGHTVTVSPPSQPDAPLVYAMHAVTVAKEMLANNTDMNFDPLQALAQHSLSANDIELGRNDPARTLQAAADFARDKQAQGTWLST